MDHRRALEYSDILVLGGVDYKKIKLIGCGANAMVYKAAYHDGLLPDKEHTVLIKELFPFHKDGLIYRGEDGSIRYTESASEYFELHKKSFLRGIIAHLDLQELRADKATLNINSYESNGTFYTILGYSGGQTLKEAVESGAMRSLYEITACMLNVLAALRVFHQNNMLHLDISPDNVLLMPAEKGESERSRDVKLIDYNSVWSLEELTDHTGLYYSIKANYSAPEVRLHDYKSIGPASDIFSVCAMFLEMIQGKPLEYDDLTSNNKKMIDKNTGLLSDCPETVIHKVTGILKCGLRLPPNQRYQRIEEAAEDFEELLNRLDGIGVTHSALWDASSLNFHNMAAGNPAYSYLEEDPLQSIPGLPDHGHSVVIGSGGMGKTAILLRLWKRGVCSYHPDNPVPVYIPLYNYQGGILPFMKGTLLEKLKFDQAAPTYGEALHSLNHLLDTPLKGNLPSVQLLLDGWNEVTGDRRGLLRELDELMKQKGVQVILTSRTDNLPFTMNRINLRPVEETKLRDFLTRNKAPYPQDNSLLELLGNPMMLAIYVKACQVKQGGLEAHTAKELVFEYLDSLLLSHQQAVLEQEEEQPRAEFTIKYLLPLFAEFMKKRDRYTLTPQEAYAIVKRCFHELHTTGFLRAFPQYIGRVKAITGGADNAEEWFGYAVSLLLQNSLALIWQDEGGNYHLFHQSFIDYLSVQGSGNSRALLKARIRRGFPYAVAGILLAAMLSLGVIKLIDTLPGEYPQTAEEINTVNMAMNSLVYSVGLLDLQLSSEQNILNGVGDKLLQGDKEAFESWLSLRDRELEAAALPEYDREEASLILGYLTKPNVPIPLDVLEELYDLPLEHEAQIEAMLEVLTEYLSPDSVYGADDKKQVTQLCKERSANYAAETFIKMQQVTEPLTADMRSIILDYLPYTNTFKDKLVNMNWSDQNYAAKLEACRTADSDIVSKLMALGFQSAPGDGDVYGSVLEDYKKLLTVQDTRLELYEGAIDSASEYIRHPAPESLDRAKTTCIDAIRQILDLEDAVSAIDDKTKSEMVSLNIDIFDYSAPFDLQSYYKDQNIQTILYLLYYLNNAPSLDETLKHMAEYNIRCEVLERKIDYLGVNDLFIGIPDKDMEEFRGSFLPGLTSFSADNLPWERDGKIIQAKANSLLLEMEDVILEYSDFVGEQYTAALTLQQECENTLIQNGVTEDEAKQILEEIDKLSEKSLREQEKMLENSVLNE